MADRAALIRRAGAILFGPHWKGQFADTFDLRLRTAQRIAAGGQSCPASLLAQVEQALRDHGQALDELLLEFGESERQKAAAE